MKLEKVRSGLPLLVTANDNFRKTCEIHSCSIFFALRIPKLGLPSSTQLMSPSQLLLLSRHEMLDQSLRGGLPQLPFCDPGGLVVVWQAVVNPNSSQNMPIAFHSLSIHPHTSSVLIASLPSPSVDELTPLLQHIFPP